MSGPDFEQQSGLRLITGEKNTSVCEQSPTQDLFAKTERTLLAL